VTPTASAARDWLLGILRGLVPDPTTVDVEAFDGCGSIDFIVHAAPKVRARIIGRGGGTIGLVRQLAYIFAQTNHISKITVTVSEPERSTSSHVAEFPAVR